MQSSAYNSDDLRLFSAVHSDALKAIQEVAGGPLSQPECPASAGGSLRI